MTLSYVSADGEEGYPGQLKTDITYRISGGTELSMEMVAVTDKPTIINLTNHSFFNLAGVEGGGGILDHRMTIAADSYLPVSPAGIPLGAPHQVDATPVRFSRSASASARACGTRINRSRSGKATITITACVAAQPPTPRFAARVEDPASGRVLELWTNQPGVQFYSGNFLDGTVTGKYGRAHRQYDALCLEPQVYPNTPNRPDFPSARLDPGQTYRHISLYRFSAT